jgi:preprotein translocase subunit SecE
MAEQNKKIESDTESEELAVSPESELSTSESAVEAEEGFDAGSSGGSDWAPAQLGVTKYVHAAFFAAGIAVTYVTGKVLELLWNALAAMPSVAQHARWLLLEREDERPTYTMAIGALVGIISILQIYRRPAVRQWADEVASELSKVHWPDKEVVQNGTVVVIVASLFATLYVGLLDRFWIFVTTLVYGA